MEIEKSMPVPDRFKIGELRKKYPFRDMLVGDSVLIDDPEEQKRARNAAFMLGQRTGKKFASRQVDGGVRIWRTE